MQAKKVHDKTKRYQVEKSENALSVNIDNAIKCYIRTAYLWLSFLMP